LSDGPEVPYGHAPLFPALTKPLLTAGVPDKVAVPIWVGVAGFCSILGQYRIAIVGVALHLGLAAVYRWDPFFVEYYRRYKRSRVGRRLEP
jgi:type IV secretory pathway VirB3-like protein